MADSPRLQKIQQMLQEDPGDTFLLYGLAMEHMGLGNDEEAVNAFRHVSSIQPEYVPPYLMLGQILQRLGRTEEAIDVLQRGSAVARSIGNEHALSEMQGLLSILE